MVEYHTIAIPAVAFLLGWTMMMVNMSMLHKSNVQLVVQRVHDSPPSLAGSNNVDYSNDDDYAAYNDAMAELTTLGAVPGAGGGSAPLTTVPAARFDEQLLVLVIAGGHLPRYRVNRAVWRMIADHVAPLGIQIYFVAMDNTIKQDGLYDRSLLFVGTDSLVGGVLNATVKGLEYVYQNKLPGHKAKFVLRTNLSSFWVFSRLLALLSTHPTTNFYAGVVYGSGIGPYASGAGTVMSVDVAVKIYESKDKMSYKIYDDEAIGQMAAWLHVPRIENLHRCDYYIKPVPFSLLPPKGVAGYPDCSESTYHYRVKSEDTAADSKAFTFLYMYYYAPARSRNI